MKPDVPPHPWHTFFLDVDQAMEQRVVLHCLGGFAIAMVHGLPRVTVDVDCLSVTPVDQIADLQMRAGLGSALHRKHGVYLQHVGIVTVHDNYEDRLMAIFPGVYQRLEFFALDAHDIALSKLQRNSARDREDMMYLGAVVPLDPTVLEQRYSQELRPYLTNVERHDLTLRLWLEMLHGL